MAQGMGGGRDSADPDGGPNANPSGGPAGGPASAGNPGVSTDQNAVEAGYDTYGGDEGNLSDAQEGLGFATSYGSPTGAHPDSTTNQHYGTGLSYGSSLGSTNYSAYDSPETHDHQSYSNLEDGAPPGASLDKSYMDLQSIPGFVENSALGMEQSPMTSPGYQGAVSPSQNPSSVTHDFDIDTALQNSVPTTGVSLTAPPGTESTALGMEEVASFTAPTTDTHDASLATLTGATTSPTTDTHDASLATLTGATTSPAAKNISLNAPTTAQIEEARQRHRAIEARQWGKTALDAKTAWGVLDAQLKETETKTYFGLNFEVPKMSKNAKHNALVAFRDKYGKQIEAYNKNYNYQAKQSKQEPGLMNPPAMLAGLINPILGMVVRIGQKYGYNESPMEKAITAAEIDAGIKEADHGEGVDQSTCEAKGYTWNEGLQACYRSDGTLFAGSERSNAVSSGV